MTMEMDRLKELVRDRHKMIPIALLGIAVVCGVLALAKVAGYFVASARAERIVEQAIARNTADPKVVESQVAKSKPVAEALKKKNLFSPAPKKEHPVKSVMGIFGDEAFINGKWYKAGAKVGDAKIVAIGPDSVTTQWEGKEKIFRPIDASSAPDPGGPRGRPSRPGSKPSGGTGGGADMVVVQSETRPGRGPGGRPGGPGGPGDMRGRFSEMSEAERDRIRARMQDARERYSQMSEKEREKFRAEMRKRFGGGLGGRGDPGGRGGRR